ncbi:MAG: hypothetical protein EOP48_26620 [Sphingobacteriales bacterium]|nr:MAG: hypothetical protein EOP48_26620 [Sphingobacteriales bacterium]
MKKKFLQMSLLFCVVLYSCEKEDSNGMMAASASGKETASIHRTTWRSPIHPVLTKPQVNALEVLIGQGASG